MEITAFSDPPNEFEAIIPSSKPGGAVIFLSNNRVAENAAPGQVIGTLAMGETGTWAFSIPPGYDAGGRVAIDGNNLLTTNTPFDFEAAAEETIRIQALRAAPYALIVREATLVVFDVTELNALTLSDNSYPYATSPGTELAVISNLTAGSTRTISPNDGRVLLNESGTKLLKGFTEWSSGTIEYTITENLNGTVRQTTFTLTVETSGFDYVVNNSAELTTIIAAIIAAPATYSGKTVGMADGIYANPSFNLNNANHTDYVTFRAINLYGVICENATASNFKFIKFWGLNFVSTIYQDNSADCLLVTGNVGKRHMYRCRYYSGRNGNYNEVIDPTDLDTSQNAGFYWNNRYPEQAGILPTAISGGSVQGPLIITRKNIGNNTPDGQLNGVYPLISVGEGNEDATGTMTVVDGVITSAVLDYGGTGYTDRPLGTSLTWANRKSLGFLAYGDSSQGAPTADAEVIWEECRFSQLSKGIQHTHTSANVTVLRCDFDCIYIDSCAIFGTVPAASAGWIHIAFNRFTRPFSRYGDRGDPHSDAIQISKINSGLATGRWRIDVYANLIYQDIPSVCRGTAQGMLIQDAPGTTGNGYTVGPQGKGVSRNLVLAQTTNGIKLNQPYEIPVNYNTVVAFNGYGGLDVQLAPNEVDPLTEMSGNLSTHRTIDANIITVDQNSKFTLANMANVFVGPVSDSSSIAAILSGYASKGAYANTGAMSGGVIDFVNRTVNENAWPVSVYFTPVGGVAPSSLQTSNWSKLHGGPATFTATPAAGTEMQISSDGGATVVTDWTPNPAVVARGHYIRIRRNASALYSTTTTAGVDLNGTLRSFSVTTDSLAQFSGVSNGGTRYSALSGWTGAKTWNRAIFAWEAKVLPGQPTGSKIFATGTQSKFNANGDGNAHLNVEAGTVYAYQTGFPNEDGAWHRFIAIVDWTKTDELEAATMVRDAGIFVPRTNSGSGLDLTGTKTVSMNTTFSAGLGLFGEGDGGGVRLNGSIRMFWAHFFATTDSNLIPDIKDPAIAALWSADNINLTDGSGPLGYQPDFFFHGDASAWEAGIANKGARGGTLSAAGTGAYAND